MHLLDYKNKKHDIQFVDSADFDVTIGDVHYSLIEYDFNKKLEMLGIFDSIDLRYTIIKTLKILEDLRCDFIFDNTLINKYVRKK